VPAVKGSIANAGFAGLRLPIRNRHFRLPQQRDDLFEFISLSRHTSAPPCDSLPLSPVYTPQSDHVLSSVVKFRKKRLN
jgi:hypothetical protein